MNKNAKRDNIKFIFHLVIFSLKFSSFIFCFLSKMKVSLLFRRFVFIFLIKH